MCGIICSTLTRLLIVRQWGNGIFKRAQNLDIIKQPTPASLRLELYSNWTFSSTCARTSTGNSKYIYMSATWMSSESARAMNRQSSSHDTPSYPLNWILVMGEACWTALLPERTFSMAGAYPKWGTSSSSTGTWILGTHSRYSSTSMNFRRQSSFEVNASTGLARFLEPIYLADDNYSRKHNMCVFLCCTCIVVRVYFRLVPLPGSSDGLEQRYSGTERSQTKHKEHRRQLASPMSSFHSSLSTNAFGVNKEKRCLFLYMHLIRKKKYMK